MGNVWPKAYPELECIICQEDIEPRNKNACRPLLCKHFYHYDCLQKWFDIQTNNGQKTHCPYCRRISYKILSLETNANGTKSMKFFKPAGRTCGSRFEIEEDTCRTCLIGSFGDDLTVCRQCLVPTHTFCFKQDSENPICNVCAGITNQIPVAPMPVPIVAQQVPAAALNGPNRRKRKNQEDSEAQGPLTRASARAQELNNRPKTRSVAKAEAVAAAAAAAAAAPAPKRIRRG